MWPRRGRSIAVEGVARPLLIGLAGAFVAFDLLILPDLLPFLPYPIQGHLTETAIVVLIGIYGIARVLGSGRARSADGLDPARTALIERPDEYPKMLRLPLWTAVLLISGLVFGIIARLVCPDDMEWKSDEVYTVEHARRILETGAWPAVGMDTSAGIPNPGGSLWAFVPLVAVAESPVGVCRLVMLLNAAALLGFAGFAIFSGDGIRSGPPVAPTRGLVDRLAAREAWLWGVGLMAVNPYVVRISRKIWPPSLLVPLTLVFTLGHSRRDSRAGAFGWGLSGALLGQIHLSGYFLACGVFLWTLLARIRRFDDCVTRWGWWIAGSGLGAAGLIPWILAPRDLGAPGIVFEWSIGSFYLRSVTFARLAFDLSLGHTAWYSYTHDFDRFTSGPELGGAPTHLAGWLHESLYWIGLFGIATWAAREFLAAMPGVWRRRAGRAVRRFRRDLLQRLRSPGVRDFSPAWRLARRWLMPGAQGAICFDTQARFCTNATAVAGVVLLILVCRIIHLHYVHIFVPFVFMWLTCVFARRRRMLAAVLIIQALVTLAMLVDLHRHGGASRGDYGRSFGSLALSLLEGEAGAHGPEGPTHAGNPTRHR